MTQAAIYSGNRVRLVLLPAVLLLVVLATAQTRHNCHCKLLSESLGTVHCTFLLVSEVPWRHCASHSESDIHTSEMLQCMQVFGTHIGLNAAGASIIVCGSFVWVPQYDCV